MKRYEAIEFVFLVLVGIVLGMTLLAPSDLRAEKYRKLYLAAADERDILRSLVENMTSEINRLQIQLDEAQIQLDQTHNCLYSQWANAVYYRGLLAERNVTFNWTEPFELQYPQLEKSSRT